MSRFKRVLGLGFLVGLVAAAAMAVPAQASNLKGVCVIEGVASMTDKDDKNADKPPLPGTTGDDKGVRLSGGHGSYDFDALNIVCAGTEKGQPALKIITVNSKGWFDNIICGTGMAFSHARKDNKEWGSGEFHGTTLASINEKEALPGAVKKDVEFYAEVVESLEYKIEFVDRTGHIHFNNDDSFLKDLPKPTIFPQDKVWGKPTEPLSFAGWVELGFTDKGLDLLNNKARKDPLDLTKYNCVNEFAVLAVVVIDKTPKE